MNDITISALFDELEKIALEVGGDPFAGIRRFTGEGLAEARAGTPAPAQAQPQVKPSPPPLKPQPIPYAATQVDPLARVPPRAAQPAAQAAAAAKPSLLRRAASTVGRAVGKYPRLALAGAGALGLGAGSMIPSSS